MAAKKSAHLKRMNFIDIDDDVVFFIILVFGMADFAWYVIFGICVGASLVLSIIEAFGVNPWLKKKILAETESAEIPSVRFDNEAGKDEKNDISEKGNYLRQLLQSYITQQTQRLIGCN